MGFLFQFRFCYIGAKERLRAVWLGECSLKDEPVSPPGSGKSSVFPLRQFGDWVFNADDRAAELNGGSYREIPLHVRRLVNEEFESFVYDSIAEPVLLGWKPHCGAV